MNLEDKIILLTSSELVWEHLNKAATLKDCIPGCSELNGDTINGFTATITQKVGPVKATFKGYISISDIVKNKSYTITGEGSGGAAGFAKGKALILLTRVPEGTQLSYQVEAKIGGKLAQLGGRIINGFAKNMAAKFFENFKKKIEP